MNYFVSCLYGEYEKFLSIIKDLDLKDGDYLWIIGDVLDGNVDNPEDNLKILDEIEKNQRIKLVLGDHEYVRVMQELCGEKDKSKWDQKAAAFTVPGKSFDEYIKESMTDKQRNHYFLELLSKLSVSESVKIGNKLIYMVHGAPSKYTFDQREWEKKVCLGLPDLNKDYSSFIMGDPKIDELSFGEGNTRIGGLVTVCGQLSPEQAALMVNQKLLLKGAFYHNGILAIGRDGVADPIYVIGIDEWGFFVHGKYD